MQQSRVRRAWSAGTVAISLLGLMAFASQPALAAGPVDFNTLTDVGSLVSVRYESTAFNRRTGQLRTNVVVTNTSAEQVQCPLVVVINSISAPGLTLPNATGQTPTGEPYIDLSAQVGTDGLLSPGESTAALTLVFNNPSRARFTFDSTCLGVAVLGPVVVNINSPTNQFVTRAGTTDVTGFVSSASSVSVNGVNATLSNLSTAGADFTVTCPRL